MFATWRDVNFEGGFAVTEKNDGELRWTSKDKEQGKIPLPDELVRPLIKLRQRFPATRLIFPRHGEKTERTPSQENQRFGSEGWR